MLKQRPIPGRFYFIVCFSCLLTILVTLSWIYAVIQFSEKFHSSSKLKYEGYSPYADVEETEKYVEGFDKRKNCCVRQDLLSSTLLILRNDTDQSTCSDEATIAGKGQKVISYSLYANGEGSVIGFLEGLKPNLDAIETLYPGWIARIYTNIVVAKFCEFMCKYPFLHLCDIRDIPGSGNFSHLDGRSWRFLPLGDPMVDIFISRDLDSRIYPRERAAVEGWEHSTYSIHTMRDHPLHNVPMLGGMWGAKNTLLGPQRSKRLQLKIIQKAKAKSHKGWDQTLLESVIYGELSNETMAHDSYLCEHFPDGVVLPFPTRRENSRFVGSIADNPIGLEFATCPEKCRRQPSWTEC